MIKDDSPDRPLTSLRKDQTGRDDYNNSVRG
jgi:hypothetical protein